MSRTRIRASAIIIKNNRILLIHRKKEGREYWVFPGGGIEEGETGKQTIKREVKEETGLKVSKAKLAFEELIEGVEQPFFLCEVEEGKVKLGGPESKRHSKENWYQPEWVGLSKVFTINLVPESVKIKLIQIT